MVAICLVWLAPAPILAQTISISNGSQDEGNTGTTDLVFQVTLSAPSGSTVMVDYTTTDISAIAGSDYVAASDTVTFMPGETSQPVTVQVNGDTDFESDEFFFVDLSSPVNATISILDECEHGRALRERADHRQ